ncbi:MAG: OmpA family protein [Gemmatimonadales bacterium]|nr:OmpA family protein [Gemmatimonadales bacterium]
MRRFVLALTVAQVAASAAHAQRSGTFEVGVFPTIAYFDRALRLNQAKGGPGARIGYFLSDRLALEAEGSWVPTNGPNGIDVKYMPLHARVVFNFPASEHVGVLIGGGYTHTRFRDGLRLSDHGVTGNAGVRLGLGDVTSIRIDTYVDYIPSPENGSTDNWHWGFQPGLSFMLGGRSAGPRDRDGDGVPDDVDECRRTPAGDRVDARGCTVVDTDGDGVFDDADACPDTPAGDRVDAKGCPVPRDADGDGVNDDADACPDTPAGAEVDAKGCPVPTDADGDGVNNDVDACPDTPAGEQVDAKGCPLPKDGDGDGVNDDADRCPSTPSGVEVDAEGCQVLFEPTRKTLILEGVNFETGQSTLTPESETILNGVAESLVANDTIRVQVTGHTDNTGGLALNRRLSRARAEAVRAYLVSRGVAEDRLTARGFGPDQPIASNRTVEGRAQNRRVELTRLN